MIRLHYSPPMCSLASMAALELAGADYEAVPHDMAGDRSALHAISPPGRIPVLETGDGVVTDTIAIIAWLSHRFPAAALLPTDADGIVAALSKMAWFGSHLHIVRRRYARPELFGAPEEALATMRAVARPVYWSALEQVDAWIGAGGLGGAGIEAYALLFYHWAASDAMPVAGLPHYSGLAARMLRYAGIRHALALHESPLVIASA